MTNMKKIDPASIPDNPVWLIGQEWMLITAGKPEKFNTMTASWGTLGFLWGKPVAFVFVRPERYTYEFMEAEAGFTLSFLSPQYRKALNICGSVSGRDTDKAAQAGLTPFAAEHGGMAFEEARLILECRKLYADFLEAEHFTDKRPLEKWYGEKEGGLHKMYVGEILSAWEK